MINTISWKTYFVFMVINFATIPAVYFLFPETNAHKLERLDAIFAEAHDKRYVFEACKASHSLRLHVFTMFETFANLCTVLFIGRIQSLLSGG